MKILGIDTSTKKTVVALTEDFEVVAEYGLKGDMQHSERVTDLCEDIFKNLNFDISDIDLISVGIGPGSFTGMRIALTFAKTLAQVLKKEIIGVSSLKVYALKHSEITASVIDARRDTLYGSIVKYQEGLQTIVEDGLFKVDEFRELVKKSDAKILSGPDAKIFEEALGIKKAPSTEIFGADIARLGLIEYKRRGADDYYTILPNYLKMSQAQKQYEDKIRNNR